MFTQILREILGKFDFFKPYDLNLNVDVQKCISEYNHAPWILLGNYLNRFQINTYLEHIDCCISCFFFGFNLVAQILHRLLSLWPMAAREEIHSRSHKEDLVSISIQYGILSFRSTKPWADKLNTIGQREDWTCRSA